MGMSMGSGKKGPMADINVTPLVDVMLVLLVIFMVTAPMLFSGVDLKLPKTKKVNTINLRPELVILSITENEKMYLGKKLIDSKNIISAILARLKETNAEVVYLRADYNLKYEKVAKMIAHLKKSGISNIALVTETEKAP